MFQRYFFALARIGKLKGRVAGMLRKISIFLCMAPEKMKKAPTFRSHKNLTKN